MQVRENLSSATFISQDGWDKKDEAEEIEVTAGIRCDHCATM